MWAYTLSHKRSPATTRQHQSSSCKGKEQVAKDENLSIPESWDLSENQRHFIESFMDPKAK